MVAPDSGRIFVLIPTYNRRNILSATLTKVREQLPPEIAQIFVVDAGSTDGTCAEVLQQCPSAEIIKGHSDMWWTATVNHGQKHLAKTARTGDRVLLMNDDIDLEKQALIRLLEASSLEPGAIIGAVNIVRRLDEPSRVYFCGGRYDLYFARHKANVMAGKLWHESISRFLQTDFLYGRLLVIPWNAFELGCRFDEDTFPQYSADEDFSYDAKHRGVQVLVDTKSIVYVNEATTAHFSLSFSKGGWHGIWKALNAFNSCYNIKQGWAFSKRYAKWPIVFMLCRYAIIFFNENFRINQI